MRRAVDRTASAQNFFRVLRIARTQFIDVRIGDALTGAAQIGFFFRVRSIARKNASIAAAAAFRSVMFEKFLVEETLPDAGADAASPGKSFVERVIITTFCFAVFPAKPNELVVDATVKIDETDARVFDDCAERLDFAPAFLIRWRCAR